MGLDLGSKRIGVAISDESGVVATPLLTIIRKGDTQDVKAIGEVISEYGVRGIVLGLPIDLEGKETPASRQVRQLALELERALGLPIRYWDERFSTVQAERVLISANMRRNRRKQVIDQVAATLILQTFLDAHCEAGDNR